MSASAGAALAAVVLVVVLSLIGSGYVWRAECVTTRGTIERSWSYRISQITPYVAPEKRGCSFHSGTRVALSATGIWALRDPTTPTDLPQSSIEEQASQDRPPALPGEPRDGALIDPEAEAFLRDVVALRRIIDDADGQENAQLHYYVTVDRADSMPRVSAADLLRGDVPPNEIPELTRPTVEENRNARARLELFRPETDQGRRLKKLQLDVVNKSVEPLAQVSSRLTTREARNQINEQERLVRVGFLEFLLELPDGHFRAVEELGGLPGELDIPSRTTLRQALQDALENE